MKTRIFLVAFSAVMVSTVPIASAAVQYQLTSIISSSGVLATAPPVVTFTQNGANAVTVMVDLTGLTLSSEKLTGLYFNYDQVNLDLSAGDFGANFTVNNSVNGVAAPTFTVDDPRGNPGGLKADGDGYYNVLAAFATSTPNSLDAGEKISFDITKTGLLEADFDGFLSEGGSKGAFSVAAHVQGLDTGASIWLGNGDPIPEPTSVVVWGIFTLLCGAVVGCGRRLRPTR